MDISISIDFLTNNLEIEFLKIKQLYSLNKDIDYMVYYNKIPTSAELEKDKLTNRIELTNYIGTSIRQIKIIDCLEEYYLDFNKDWLGEKISCLLNNRLNWSNDNLEKLKEYGINF